MAHRHHHGHQHATDALVTVSAYYEVVESEAFHIIHDVLISVAARIPGVVFFSFAYSGNLAVAREGFVDAESYIAYTSAVVQQLKALGDCSKQLAFDVISTEAQEKIIRAHFEQSFPPEFNAHIRYFTVFPSGFHLPNGVPK